MIVERGKQSQQSQQQQQHQQQSNLQPSHLSARQQRYLQKTFATGGSLGAKNAMGEEEEEEDGDDGENDEENIVIDMADEDEDEEEGGEADGEGGLKLREQEGKELRATRGQVGKNAGGTTGVCTSGTNNNNNARLKHPLDVEEDERFSADQLQFNVGDLVWFDPNLLGYCIPGKVIDYYPSVSVLTVEGYGQPIEDTANDENHNRLLMDAEERLQIYNLSDIQQLRAVKLRKPLSDEQGVKDLVDLDELSLESIIWNLKFRYKQELVYSSCGNKILISVNPFKQLCNTYNLDQVNNYDSIDSSKLRSLSKCCPNITNQNLSSALIRWLLIHDDGQVGQTASSAQQTPPEPHIFGLANEALKRLLISGQDQCFILLGESGSGKTETCKLLVQYLATVNKSPTNLMTEQILESIQVLESFGNAKTSHNDNSSRFGKLLQIRFNLATGFISDAKTIDLNLLDRTRIVSQVENERNYHIFYELLAGLSTVEREKYGLQTSEKYFYLNQGHCNELPNKEDGDDFRSILASMQVLGFNYEEQDTIFRILATVLHLGNIYFHRKVLAVRSGKVMQQQQRLFMSHDGDQTPNGAAGGVEGVEIGSDTEVRWVSHLLQIQFELVMRCLTVRTTESTTTLPCNAYTNQQQPPQIVVDRVVTPLNIDQALDTRDAIARALYTCLFKWLVQRINVMINGNANCDDSNKPAKQAQPNASEPIYMCQTSESLCEFQPDKLTDSGSSSLSRNRHKDLSLVSHGRQDLAQQITSATVTILDAFGFENLNENNFEQLCINYTAELLQYHTCRYLLRLEQAEYTKERLRWTPISTFGAQNGLQSAQNCVTPSTGTGAAAIVNLITKKPLGILALLDDECNFPKATDQSFAEKCHHNHTLNENYQRARLASNCQEFGIRHFKQSSRLVWYQVDGFIEKNRDVLRSDIVDLLLGSKMAIVADMLRKLHQTRELNTNSKTLSRTYDGRYVSMKPRATTVAARFQDALHNNIVLESINYSTAQTENSQYSSNCESTTKPNPWFVICLKPNRSKLAQLFDVAYVQEQVLSMNLLEIAQIRKTGYPIKMRYGEFVRRYKCLVPQKFLDDLASCQDIRAENQRLQASNTRQEFDGLSAGSRSTGEIKRAIRDVCSAIVEFRFKMKPDESADSLAQQYQCGLTKMFLNEKLYHRMEQARLEEHLRAIYLLQKTLRMWLVRREYLTKRRASIIIQAHIRAYLARRKFWHEYALIVNLQRRWRSYLTLKRRRMLEAKRRAQRQQQHLQLQELQSQQQRQANQLRHRIQPGQIASSKRTGNYATRLGLDIPADLAQLYRLQRDWIPVHDLTHLNQISLNQLANQESRRRVRHKDNSLSVPFIVLEQTGASRGRFIAANGHLDANRIRNLIKDCDADQGYCLQNFLAKYYTMEAPQFGYSRLPITRPFTWLKMARKRQSALKKLSKTPSELDEDQVNERFNIVESKAVAIYKLILRYIDSDLDSPSASDLDQNKDGMQKLIKFKLIADYLIYLCLTEPLLRDEIYLQLASQSWQNPKPRSTENVWKLIANCLSCFSPLDLRLSRFLLKFASDYCCDKYRQSVQDKLAETIVSQNSSLLLGTRKYPQTMLEYCANQQAIGTLALAASCYMDDHSLNGPVQVEESTSIEDVSTTNHSNKTLVPIRSRTAAEELAAAALRARNVPEQSLAGWSVEIQHEGAQSEHSCRLRGDDLILDHLAKVELLPEFAQLIEGRGNSWLVEEQRTRAETMEQLKSSKPEREQHYQQQQYKLASRQTRARKFSAAEFTAPNFPQQLDKRRHSGVSQRSSDFEGRWQAQVSSELDLPAATRLSQTSKLNRRYIGENSSEYSSPTSGNQHGQLIGGSRLAKLQQQRYAKYQDKSAMPDTQQLNRRSMSMQELQLASSALNCRYFNNQAQLAPSNHYASSYINQQQQQISQRHYHYNVGLMQHMSSQPMNRRRSQTPNSLVAHLPGNRMSSSAYGSESRNSSSHLASPSDVYSERRGRTQERSSGSLTRDGLRFGRNSRPRRSASSSSQTPRQMNGASSDYASAYSDYERVGDPRYVMHGAPPDAYAPNNPLPPNLDQHRRLAMKQSHAGGHRHRREVAKPQNAQLERCKPTKSQMSSQLSPANADSQQQQPPPYSHYMGSSAVSDTSEAPSLASHVRGIKVPQHNGDLDQYLDDLFNPVLDEADLDELSDARSLATSIRGLELGEEVRDLCDANILSDIIRGVKDEDTGKDEGEQVCNEPAGEPADARGSSTMLSPTFESLLKSLKGEPGGLSPKLFSNEPGANSSQAPIMSQLGELNLSELKALNEKLEHEIQAAQSNRPSLELMGGKIPAPPPQPTFSMPTDDIYSRARTVRIGKWRWPPAPGEAQSESETPGSSQLGSRDFKRLSQTDSLRSESPNQPISKSDESPLASAESSSPDTKLMPPPPVAQLCSVFGQNLTGSVGKLKISSEMKAKLEQLTTTSTTSANSGRESSSSSSAQTGQQLAQTQPGIVSQVKSLLDAAPEEGAGGVKKIGDQRKNLLENQLLGAKSGADSNSSARPQGERAGGKVMAAKQQLAAAAGVALAALDSGQGLSAGSSLASSRRQSGLAGGQESGRSIESAMEERQSRVFSDELGPQSKTAISQRQAFYQMSASSDQIDHLEPDKGLCGAPASEHGGSEVQLRNSCEKIPPPTAISSDNLQLGAPVLQQATLTRAMQMSSNLNEAGRSSELGKESDRIYGQSIAKSLAQRQHESLMADERIRSQLQPGEQWVSSSPDPTLESSSRRRVKRASEGHDQAQKRRLAKGTSAKQLQLARANGDKERRDTAWDDDACLVYANVDWQVKIRKEFFLPSETYDDPLVVQLIFAQLVADVFNPRHWTRLNQKERAAIKSLMKDNSIGYSPSLPQIGQLQQVKRELVRMARSFGLYFTRSYQASNFSLTGPWVDLATSCDQEEFEDENGEHGESWRRKQNSADEDSNSSSSSGSERNERRPHQQGRQQHRRTPGKIHSDLNQAVRLMHRLQNAGNLGADWIDMVAVHHSGLRLVSVVDEPASRTKSGDAQAVTQSTQWFGYKVLETLKYRDMTDVSQVGQRELLVSMRNGKKCWLISSDQTIIARDARNRKTWTSQADQLANLLRCFHADYNDHLSSGSSKQAAQGDSRTQVQQREKRARANKDALLASDDDHHGDRFEQRQAPNSIGKLHPAPNSNNDLAHGERVLSNSLANSSKTPKQLSKQPSKSKQQRLLAGNNPKPAPLSPLSAPISPSATAPASSPNSARAPAQPVSAGGPLEVESKESQAGKKNLWHSSLSRMSNKFSIFGGSQSRSSNNKSKSQTGDQPESRQLQQQQHQEAQVVLDNWIETKVDFDEDEQTAEERPADLVSGEKQDGSAGGTQLAPDLAKDCDHTLAQKDGSSSRKLSEDQQQQAGTNAGQAEDGKYSLLQFALYNFREAIDKYSLESRANKGQASGDTSTLRGSLKLIETLRNSSTGQLIVGKERKSSRLLASSGARVQSSGQSSRQADDWTWRELAEMVKFTQQPIRQSLLKLPSEDLNKRAVDCFNALMLYMGDSSGTSNSSKQPNLSFKGDEVECVYLILMNCHNFPILRDEVYCQLMKQTTNNRSSKADSCLRGWRLFSIVAAYFDCSETFKPYLVKYLETAAYDKRRAYCSIASLCLQNLRKTFKYGGRKNVPSIEEIAATSAGRNSKRQIYRLPGGTERVINTKSTTVVDDIIHEICSNMLNITEYDEMLEFSLYCIADGDLYTMPLNRDEYILDITTELIKNHQQYFLIFCRSIWHYPLRLDSKLYIEVIFNQIAPDYLEGLLLVLPNKTRARQSDPSKQQDSAQVQPLRLRSKLVREIARIAALLHRASGTDYMPHKDEIKYLLPKPIITAMKQYQRALGSGAQVEPIATTSSSSSSASSTSSVRNAGSLERAGSGHDTITTTPQKWIELVQNNWREMSAFDTLDAKAQFLDIVRHWPLFGSSFFAIKFIQRDLIQPLEFILALNKFGIQMLDMSTHETVHKYSFNEVISTRKVRSEDGALFLDLKCGNLMKRTIIRIQTDQAHEISRLIKQYIDIELLQQRQQKQVPCPSDTGSAVEFITQVIN